MRCIYSVAPELSVGLTDDNKLVVMVETSNRMAEVTDIDALARKLRELELIQMERTQLEAQYAGRCHTSLIHEDNSEERCVLPKAHLLDDSDHQDAHGHRAPVLVHQSTIRQVKAIQDARDAGLID